MVQFTILYEDDSKDQLVKPFSFYLRLAHDHSRGMESYKTFHKHAKNKFSLQKQNGHFSVYCEQFVDVKCPIA